jgi:hypothetical protein
MDTPGIAALAAGADKPAPSGASRAAHRGTNFYPLYGAANDQVDRISPIAPVAFQRVLPRYRLSTSETRDQGTGPMFDGAVIPARGGETAPPPTASAVRSQRVAGQAGAAQAGAAVASGSPPAPTPGALADGQGLVVDLYA